MPTTRKADAGEGGSTSRRGIGDDMSGAGEKKYVFNFLIVLT